MTAVTVFDGHNDVLLRLRKDGTSFFDRTPGAQLDLPRAREGGFGGGFFAVFVPGSEEEAAPGGSAADVAMAAFSERHTMPPTPELPTALRTAMSMAADLFRIEAISDGA